MKRIKSFIPKGLDYAFHVLNIYIITMRRPLPRGLIKFEEVTTFINIATLSMMVYGVLLGLRFGISVGAIYELQVLLGSKASLVQWNLQTRDTLGGFVPCREVVPISEEKNTLNY